MRLCTFIVRDNRMNMFNKNFKLKDQQKKKNVIKKKSCLFVWRVYFEVYIIKFVLI